MKYIYNIGRGELEDTTAPVTTQLDLFENKPTTTVSSPGPVNRVSTGQGEKPIVKQKYKYELQKEVENLKKQNRVLAKHQTPIPEDVEDVKYESVPGVFMGQSSNKKYTPKDATAMNQQWDRVSPEDKNTLRLIQKTNYEYGTNNEQKPLWLEKAEKNKKNTSREARTEQKRGGSSTGVTAKIQKKPIGYVKTIAPNKKFDLWNDGIKTDKSPQNIARVRKIVNDSVKSFGHTKFLTQDEHKYLDKKKEEAPLSVGRDFGTAYLDSMTAEPEQVAPPVTEISVTQKIKQMADARLLAEQKDWDHRYGVGGLPSLKRPE